MSAVDRLKLFGDGADSMTRRRAEAELQTEAEQRQRRSEHAVRAESEHVQALRHEIADLRHELANVQARLAERDKDFIGVADTIVAGLDKVPAWVEKMIETRVKISEAEMCGKIAEKFGELMGRIAAIDPQLARAAKGESFKFASEKTGDNGDVVDLPNPLRLSRTVVN